MKSKTRVLFVCLGNICRSPLAEGVFGHRAMERDLHTRFEIDSAGTGDWHIGELADPRMRRTAESHGVQLTSRARQVAAADYETFDWIICMDDKNRAELIARGAPESKLRLLLEMHPESPKREVPDPYFGEDDGFEEVFGLVDAACQYLLDGEHLTKDSTAP